MIGVVIPTLNEAETLSALLGDLRRIVMPLDIVVVDGGSSDGTVAAAAAAGARAIRAPRGRATQMNAGSRAVRGDWLLFLHADCRVPPLARHALLTAVVNDAELQAAVFRFAIDLPSGWKAFIELGQRLRQACYRLPYGDQGLLVQRTLFESVGGFPDMPLFEDVALVRSLRRRTRLQVLPAAVLTSGRRYRTRGVLRTWLANTGLITLYFAGVSSRRLARWRDGGQSNG